MTLSGSAWTQTGVQIEQQANIYFSLDTFQHIRQKQFDHGAQTVVDKNKDWNSFSKVTSVAASVPTIGLVYDLTL
jgi:hypothetical protein